MARSPGTFVGPYEIVALLGAGSMGEVYRARDARLKRDIALKVLPPNLSTDPHAVGRFRREAETASALNHPHIVHIYDIGDANLPTGGPRYIAMELVPGGSMRARLQMGDRWAQLLAPLAQVCDALATAHRANIVHRDLKPANIMITGDGYAKVVDFGLAKLIEERGGQDVTAAADHFTETGAVIGTIGYMSPEQARGEPLDHRSDIFSIGCILYEVLCGQQPFRGSSTVATLHAIGYDDPPAIVSINRDAPEALCAIASKCLEKDPARRYQSAGEIAHALRAFATSSSISSANFAPTQTVALARVGLWRRPAVLGSVAAAGIVAAVALGAWLNRDHQPPPVAAPAAALRVEKLTNRGNAQNPAISPDGRYLAYSSLVGEVPTIWLRDLVEKNETRLVEADASTFLGGIRFSRDGRSIYYTVFSTAGKGASSFKIPLIGGSPSFIRSGGLTLLSPDEQHYASTKKKGDTNLLVISGLQEGDEKEVAEVGRGGPIAWSPDGEQLLFERESPWSASGVYLPADDVRASHPLFVVSTDGTGERQIAVLDQFLDRAWWSEDGSAILCAVYKNQRDRRLIGVNVATGEARQISDKIWSNNREDIKDVFWLDARRILISDGSGLWRVTYPTGPVEKIEMGTREYSQFRISSDRTRLVAVEGGLQNDLLVSAEPEKGPFQSVARGTDVTFSFGWTPDGRLVYSSNEAGSYDLYVMDRDGSNRKALTFDRSKDEIQPAPTPDGKYVVFVSNRSGENGLYRVNADGTGLTQLTSPAPGLHDRSPSVTPDSRWVYYAHWDNGPRFFKLPIDGGTPVAVKGRTTSTVAGLEESGYGASASPDQKSMAFVYFTLSQTARRFSQLTVAISDASGRILQQAPFKDIVAIGDHESVQWSNEGRAVFYPRESNLWKWPIGGTPFQFTHLEGRVLDFGWSPDGKLLGVVRELDTRDIVMVSNLPRD